MVKVFPLLPAEERVEVRGGKEEVAEEEARGVAKAPGNWVGGLIWVWGGKEETGFVPMKAHLLLGMSDGRLGAAGGPTGAAE